MAQETSNGRAASNLSQRETLDILEGNLLLEHCPTFRNVRIFLSSGYADCKFEREVLHKKAFPALRAYCESLGIQFYVVDLFWGLGQAEGEGTCTSDAAALTTLERDGLYQLAIKEIKLCQQTSMGPNFVTLLAQSYGHRPLCTLIEEDDFKVMCASLDDPARELLCRWYRRNNNSQPPGYVLLRNQETAEKEPWSATHEALSKTVRRAAKVALTKDPARIQKYLMSALEKEVIAGIFSIKTNPNEGCYWIKRTFTDLYEQRGNDPALVTYADLTPGRRGLEFDVETIKSLNHLKEARMCAKYIGLESENIFEFQLKWQKNKGLDPEHNPSHCTYLESLCERVASGLQRRIGDRAAFMTVLDMNRTYQEVLHHGAYCRSRGTTCLDRSPLSARIQSYLDGGVDSPLVIHGPAGSGKTTVMAAAAYRLRERSVLTKRIIVVRFLGTTPSSSSIRHTLKSICEQLSIVYKEDPLDIPADYRGIVDHFSLLLHKASSARPVCIFLDAVDLLSPEDGALGMSWLPSSLPPHVRFVLSTSSEAQYGCYPVLCGLLCRHKDCFLEVPRLSTMECEQFLSHQASFLHMQLTPHQCQVAVQSLLLCPLPLYLQLLMREVGSWTSDTGVSTESFSPATSIEGMIKLLFEQTECNHPVAMVSHSLGYITASQYGLSEVELLDILACDEQVTSELQAPPTPLQWAKLYHGLAPFLQVGVGVGGATVLRWGHRKVQEMAQSRYLGDRETTNARFQLLADYFSGKAKCQVCSHLDECPHINHQPLVLGPPGDQGCGWRGTHYNVRKLRELPYCLASCGRMEELTALLMDFRWIQACVLAASCGDIAKDFAHIIPVVPLGRNGRGAMYRDVRLLSEAVALSNEGLNASPTHLCTQLVGRLLPYAMPSGENRLLLKSILQQAIEDAHPVLVPTNPFFRAPGGPLLASMEGHRGAVSCIASSLASPGDPGSVTSMAVFSSSWDNSLKSWDLGTVGVAKTFDGHTDRVLCVASSADGRHVVSGSRDRSIRYWEACTGHCLAAMPGHTAEVNTVVMTTDGSKAASGSADGSIMVWNVDTQSSTFGQLVFTMKSLKSSLLSMTLSYDDRHLAAGTQDGTVMIVDIVSGEVLAILKEQGPIAAVALAQMEQSTVLIAGSGYGEITVWDFPSGESMHCLVQGGKEKPAITSVSAGSNGRLVTVSNKIVSVWDLKTAHHLYDLTDCRDVTCVHVADEGRLLLTGSEDHRVRIWDLETPPIPQTTKILGGSVRAVSISPCGGYCAVGGEGGTVVVCELDTLKVVQRLEEGHSGSVNHIVVLRDARTVVTAADGGLLRLWDGEEGKCLQVFSASGGAAATCVAVSHDGTLIMSGDQDGKVMMWSTKSGKNLRTFVDHKQAVVGVGFARGNSHHHMVSASADGVLCLRDFVSGKVVMESRLHKEELLCLALSPDSNFLVTGSRDRSAQVILLPGGLPSVVISGHKGAVTCVEVFSDCETCLTGSEDRTLRVWSTSSGCCLGSVFVDDVPLACAVGRNSTVLYGSRRGWVSTAAYLSGSGAHNTLLKKLQCDVASVSMGDVGPDEPDGYTSECSMRMVSPSPPLVAHQAAPVCKTTVPIKNEDCGKEQPLEPVKKEQPLECVKPLKKEQTLESGELLLNEGPLESDDHEVENREGLKDHPHCGDLVRHVKFNRELMYMGGGSEREHMYMDEDQGTVHQRHKEQSSNITSTLESPSTLVPSMVRTPQSSSVITATGTQGFLEERTPKTASPLCRIV